MKNYLKIIRINEISVTPKYQQIFNSVLEAIKKQYLETDDVLPSINDLSFALEVSRNTIEHAYRDLKKFGVIDSIPGKGYFICNTRFEQPEKILLLFNKLSSHKKIIYDAFAAKLGHSVDIDFFIYNNDYTTFRKILNGKLEHYSKLVIIAHFIDGDENAYKILNELPKEKLILMDKLVEDISGEICAVYEDFEKDIYSALERLSERLRGYHTIKIIFPENSYYSKSILTGFIRFCVGYNFRYEVLCDLYDEVLLTGTVYINLKEDDLVELIEKIIANRQHVGKDIGVISYNETAIKKIILNGITTISTNFVTIEEMAAEMVRGTKTGQIAVPFEVTIRSSL